MNPTSSECGNCGLRQPKIPLHNVRLRGIYRKLCTHCVLKLHPSSFCPFCFSLHDPTPTSSKRILCSKCPSFSHSHCVSSPQSPFLCPPCSDPSFSFFTLPHNRLLDTHLASVLLCAAKIAALSMTKALAVARAEAERRVKEAAVCRKKAREALENVGGSIKVENSAVGFVNQSNGISNSNNGLLLLHGNVVNNGSSTTKQ